MGMVLIISGIANIIPLYMGWSYEGCVEAIWLSRGILIIWALYSYSLLRKLVKRKCIFRRRTVFFILTVISFYVCSYLVCYLSFGYTVPLHRCLVKWCGMMLPAFIVGIYSGIYINEVFHVRCSVCTLIEIVSPLFFVFAFCYDIGALGVQSALAYKDLGVKVGLFNYMTISYMLMPFILAHAINFTLYDSSRKFVQIFRVIAIITYSFALVLAATRGTVFCVVIALFSMLGIICVKKKRNMYKKALFITGIVVFILIGCMLTPRTGLNTRMSVLADGILEEGRLITSRTVDASDEEIDKFVAIDTYSSERLNIPFITNRGTLYKLVIKEFEKNPLTGMHPGGYWYKYGLYPHNIFFENLCDTGIFSILFFIFLGITAKNILIGAMYDDKKIEIFILSISYLMYACLSGSLWNNYYIIMFLGYGISMRDFVNASI